MNNEYPWIVSLYEKIINQYRQGYANKSIVINSMIGTACSVLIWDISKWILCEKKKHIYSCNQCFSCNLMKLKNHPDFYLIDLKKEKSDSYIEKSIELVKKVIFNTSHQNSAKIIFFSNSHNIPVSFINILLKIVEDSYSNTFLFIKNYFSDILPTIFIGRCITYNLFFSINDKKNILWLQKKTHSSLKLCTIMLKLSNGSPLVAFHMLKITLLKKRESFYKQFYFCLRKKNFFLLFSFFKEINFNLIILWIYSILIDSIKIKYLDESCLINLDQKLLILKISFKYSVKKLNLSIYSWFKCRFNLINVIGIDKNVLIANELLKFEKNFFHI
ncbi:DNA polymerase III subunit delta' [Buchnera aphidicola (Anoecia corni)]|uniref:DNA polymerase III subunit delta n=1 Tax=Buchnera aphidicola (Anoecia corni) TaxID=2994477 RepID=A0AAT9IGF9_9GAMM